MLRDLGINLAKKFSLYMVGTLLVCLSLFTSIALVSYHPEDPSFNKSTSVQVQNITGEWGAYIADPIIQSIGFAVLLPLAFCFIVGAKILTRKEIKLLLARTSSLFVLVPIIAVALAFLGNPDSLHITSYGGYIGTFLKNEAGLYFDSTALLIGAVIVAMLGGFLSLSVTVDEWKRISLFVLKQLALVVGVIIWSIRFVYASMYRLIGKFRGASSEEEYPEIPKPQTIVEIANKAPKPKEVKAPMQSKLKLDPDDFELPTTTLLKEVPANDKRTNVSEMALNQNSKLLQKVLQDFGVKGDVVKIHPGPVVTLYELEPAAGTKSSRVVGLADDISRSMSAVSARIAVIPGKNALGIELPNAHRETIYLRDVLETNSYQSTDAKLPLVLGKNIAGEAIVADLTKMPHLLVAGTTGSGKSVAINTMILSLLYKHSPKQCRFIMIDPKMLELSVYDGIPHLLAPVVTEPKKAVSALKWVVKEMENRYRSMSTMGVRNIDGYNKALAEAVRKGKKLEKQVQTGFDPDTGQPMFETIEMDMEPMPFIVVIVDEMADLMLVAGKDIEASIQRLAQMARAAGIHLIMATQRPSVDVITGVIKANFPTRISFQVTSKIDSRTILGEQGAEQLLGMGDMLYMSGGGRIERVHGPFVDDKEVESIVSFLKEQGTPVYKDDITVEEEGSVGDAPDVGSSGDDMYDQAVAIVLKEKKASTSYIQRCLRIGYNRAANIIEKMEREGIVSSPNHVGKREILLDQE